MAGISFAQITVTQPASSLVFRGADDYATQTFQDPWDMKQWTDLGWYTFGTDQPLANLTNIAFSGGVFSATSTTSNPNFWLLDTYTPGSSALGKIGSLFPINSTKYRRLLLRLNLSGSGLTVPPACPAQCAQILWSNQTIFQPGGMSTSNAFLTYPGWWVYSIDLPTLGAAAGAAWTANPVDSLRIDPANLANVNINLGFARLVDSSDATLNATIAWTGSGPVDIFLDSDTTFSNGYVGQIATGATGGSYQFYAGALPAGTYHVATRPTGSSATPAYAPGSWTVDDIPTLVFTAPSPEGSSDDFATTQMGNAWDMNALTDIDQYYNVSSLAITNITAQNEAGTSLGSTRVLSGTTSGSFSAPDIFPLWWSGRGATKHIDTSRYRILSLKWGLAGQSRNIANGSIGRVIWRVFGETLENVSNDIILKHLPSVDVVQEVIADMKALPLETDAGGSPSKTGWNGVLDGFSVENDEFSSATNLYIESIRLTALEQANTSYTLQWTYANLGGITPTLQLGWDMTGTGFAGTQIASGLNPAAGSYVWNTSGLAAGTYYIYARLLNGSTVMNQNYAPWPIVVNHASSTSTLTLDRNNVWFGATNGGAVVTAPQTINVLAPAGVTWSVVSDQSYMTVSPASGVGNGSFTIFMSTSLPAGMSSGMITVTAPLASNSPQFVQVSLNVMASGSVGPSFGSFDTPATGSTGLAGSIAVTGWALDPIQVTGVDIWREPVAGEPASPALILIGNATFVAGARPDVQALYPTYPLNNQAGWGYLLLTNELPNNGVAGGIGNGTYKIHAIAHSAIGGSLDLGTKTIRVCNAAARLPFGAIDTPGQGATVSGTVTNFGWALTPPTVGCPAADQPCIIPTNGSTIFVYLDGVSLGSPVYNLARCDVDQLFPGYANSGSTNCAQNGVPPGPVGYFNLNTTLLTNGVHTIAWSVTDNAGRSQGIGSRYFTVLN